MTEYTTSSTPTALKFIITLPIRKISGVPSVYTGESSTQLTDERNEIGVL